MSTNYETNGQEELNALKRIMDFLENQLLRDSDAKGRLAEELFRHYKKEGENSIHFKMVPKNYKKEFEEVLLRENVAFVSFYDDKGNAVFLTKDIEAEKFLEVQQEIFMQHPEYYMENTPEDYLSRELKNHRDILVMDFDTKEDLTKFQNKAFERGNGYVYTVEERDNKYYAYISMKNAFSDNYKEDVPSTVLRMQADKIGPMKDVKSLQNAYDRRVQNDIMNKLRSGAEFCVTNAYNNRASYLECVNGEISCMEYDKTAKAFVPKRAPIPVPKDWNDKKEVEAFKAAFSIYTASVHNMKIMNPLEHKKHLSLDNKELEEYTYRETKRVFETYLSDKDFTSIEQMAARLENRPLFTNNFINSYAKENKEIKAENIQKALDNIEKKLKILKKEDRKLIEPKRKEFKELDKKIEENAQQIQTAQQMNDPNLTDLTQKQTELEQKKARLEKEISVFETKLNKLNRTKNKLAIEQKNYTKIQKTWDLNIKHKSLFDKAIDSVIIKSHTEIKQSENYAYMTEQEKTDMLEEVMIRVIENELTDELKEFNDFSMKHGFMHDSDELQVEVRNVFKNHLNPRPISDLMDERRESQEKQEEKERRKQEKKEQKESDKRAV